MILRLILIGVVLIAVYRLVGGSFALTSRSKEDKEIDADALEECQTCGTFVTRKESIARKGKFYCSAECLPS